MCSCCVLIAVVPHKELVPIEPDVDPGVDQTVEGHQPEEWLHLVAYLGTNVEGAKGCQ